ncbi:hypothetical protein [Novosphingobium mangrovi (ex Hu et al. 2023)]|uniref:Methyltransferase n=1 Tax=Novosphingobium mangrovi (ex Hu et al. 2023) TaxID=2930094 RepID=A0ABT0AEM2_9SPHN|nr:hypothetical protein [Novosphingobium mangrovi (ex Hu et al. 2023)]MCJ1961609.1 hypothetical protein [Novosphingobium mangrovi (ex Hu et al. 2023)]
MTGRVYIANFGEGNALWPVAKANDTVAPQAVARVFKGKRASTTHPVLDALAGIGMVRRLADGWFAA